MRSAMNVPASQPSLSFQVLNVTGWLRASRCSASVVESGEDKDEHVGFDERHEDPAHGEVRDEPQLLRLP